jgi:hypothetical protein
VGQSVAKWKLFLLKVKIKSRKCVCNETNLMHYLSSAYSVTINLHVSGLLVAHHQEVTMYICDSWYVLKIKKVHQVGFITASHIEMHSKQNIKKKMCAL